MSHSLLDRVPYTLVLPCLSVTKFFVAYETKLESPVNPTRSNGEHYSIKLTAQPRAGKHPLYDLESLVVQFSHQWFTHKNINFTDLSASR